MTFYTQIRELLLQYIGDEIKLRQFREQFVLLYDDAIRSNEEAAELAKKIEVAYGELATREINEEQFVKNLRAIPAAQSDAMAAAAGQSNLQYFEFTRSTASTGPPRSTGSTKDFTFPIRELAPV
jgi:hypothetical protein